MILALSIATINEQLSSLREQDIIKKEWDTEFNYGDVKTNIKATIEDLRLSVLEKEHSQVLFTISFGAGSTLTINDKVTSMQGWKYAFVVNINKIAYKGEDIIDAKQTLITKTANNKVIEIIRDSSIPSAKFTVECLFLDFQNANIANYSRANSSLTGLSKKDIPMFTCTLTEHFNDLQNDKNPYILGYNLTILPQLSPIENAVFQPTYCTFSTSYDETKEFQALNFLMMTENRAQPAAQSAGILDKSLITSKEDDGIFAITFPLFKSKLLQSIAEVFQKVLSTNISNSVEIKKLNLNNSEHTWWYDTDVTIQGTTRNGELNFSETDYKFETNLPWNISLQAMRAEKGLFVSTNDKKFNENVDISVTMNLVATGDALKIIVELVIDSTQDYHSLMVVSAGGAVGISGGDSKGYLNNKKEPSSGSIVIKAGTEGQLSVYADSFTDGNFEKNLVGISGLDESLKSNIDLIHTSLQTLSSNINEKLNAELSKHFEAKVILPLGNVYAFKNIRLYEEVNKRDAQDNAVVCNITYEPKYFPIKEK